MEKLYCLSPESELADIKPFLRKSSGSAPFSKSHFLNLTNYSDNFAKVNHFYCRSILKFENFFFNTNFHLNQTPNMGGLIKKLLKPACFAKQ